jgi:4,5-DOPA dioxygenase extradiol
MSLLPTVFISHGSPLHALQPGAVGQAWRDLAARLPRPQVILVASAHWETELPLLSGAAAPVTLHDFHGFPAPLYRLRYPAPSGPALAARARRLLAAAQIPAALDGTRGFDHGVWSPLLHLYPR